MSFKRLLRAVFLLALEIFPALWQFALAEPEQGFSTWKLDHAGKYDLTWYYASDKNFDRRHPDKVKVNDKEFIIRNDVSAPTVNGIFLLEYSHISNNDEVLDLGTGSGLHAVFAAEKAKRVVATDIYEPAIVNARINAQLHGVEDKIDFRVGDLFAPLKEDERFDAIYVNINFPKEADDKRRIALHERLFAGIRQHMKPNARIYFQTNFVRTIPQVLDMLERNRLRIAEMHMTTVEMTRHEPIFMLIQTP